MKPATMVAKPSPAMVRCRPGSLVKSRPTTAPLAYTSPTCSTMVTMDTGLMMPMARRICEPRPAKSKVGSTTLGSSTQPCWLMALRFISPAGAMPVAVTISVTT